jgi:4-diphosphocytidyl-2-C-methyl-D-erythritol kinase
MLARSSGSAWEVLAPAKLNLYLEVLGRRADGFHELDTLMTPVRIFDRLYWEPAPSDQPSQFSIEYDPSTATEIQTAAPADGANLAWRAFALLAKSAGIEPTGRVTLVKRIPVQAGMGGASADAAAALVLGNAAWGLNYARRRLAELAAELGSDVPFFLAGGPAICRGRGELVAAINRLPRLNSSSSNRPRAFRPLRPSTRSGPYHPSRHNSQPESKFLLITSHGPARPCGKPDGQQTPGRRRRMCPCRRRLRNALPAARALVTL